MKLSRKNFLIVIIVLSVFSIGGVILGISGFFGNGSAVPSDTMTRGLVGYWNFEEGRGTTTADISGNANTGKFMTAADSPQWTQGKVGGGLSFDGTDDYVNAGKASSLDITGAFTIEMWVKIPTGAATDKYLIAKHNGTSAQYAIILDVDAKIYLNTNNGNLQGVGVLSRDVWYHIVAGRDASSNGFIYLNGAVDATGAVGAPSSVDVNLNIAGRTTGLFGQQSVIDEVRVYNRDLSAAEIRYHYNRGGPVAYWKFDEGATTTAYDSSGNNNTGTLTNMNVITATSSWVQGKYGSALNFDGVNDYVTVASTTSLNPTSAFTLEAWVKKDQTKNQNIIFNDVHELKLDSSNNAVLRLLTGARLGADMDMETAGVTNWGSFGDPTTKAKNSTNPIQGSQDLRVVGDSVNDGVYQSIGAPGNTYRVKVSYRVVSGTLDISYDASTISKNVAVGLTGTGTIIAYVTPPTGGWSNLELTTPGVGEFFVDDVEIKQVGATLTSNGTVSSDFTHVAATYNGSALKIYINGALDKNISQAITLSPNSLETLIGAGAVGGAGYGQDYFNGTIDDVRIYSYARSPDEIRLDYNAGLSALFGPQFGCDRDPGNCMTKGLAGYWNFEEGRGTTTADISGNNNTGIFQTAAASPAWTRGAPCLDGALCGGGLSFDGADYISAGDKTLFDFGTSNFTLEAWVKANTIPGAGVYRRIISKQKGNEDYILRMGDGVWQAEILTSTGVSISPQGSVPLANTWYHVSLVRNGTSGIIYVNGVQDVISTNASLGSLDTAGSPLNIGSFNETGEPLGEFWDGLIDEVRVYNRALSAEEIRYHYNKGGPVAYLKFDEGTGATAYDSSINKYSGSLQNDMATSSWVQGKQGSALNFDGVEDFVSISDSGATNAKIISKGTISLWLKPNDVVNKQGIIQLGDSWGDTNAISLAISSSQTISLYLNVSVGTDKTVSKSSLGWNPGDWHHVAATWDSSANVSKLYIDGVIVTTDTANTLTADVDVFWIGKTNRVPDTSATYFFNGSIDDVRIYGYARNPEQIIQDYSSGFSAYMGPTSADCDRDPGSCMTKGLAGYWNFEEGRGTTTADISGNANTLRSLTAAATPGWARGKYGSSLQFDGSDDIVNAPDSATLKFGTGDFSAEIWVNTAQSAGGSTYPIYIAKDDEQATRSGWIIYQSGPDSNQVQFAVLSGGTEANVDSGATVNDGKWHHLVLVKTSSKIEGFIDGVSKGITAHTLGSTDKAVPLEIGNKAGVANRASSGAFDDARVYNRALSIQEIRYHYNKGGPIAQWKFNEGSGTTTYDGSENNNTGQMLTAAGSPTWVQGKYGSALSFDGVDDFVQIADSASLDIASAITIGMWVKSTVNSGSLTKLDRILEKNNSYTFDFNHDAWGKGNFGFNYGASWANVQYLTALPANTWIYLAATYDKQNMRVYLNGVQDNILAETRAIVPNNNGAYIGTYGTTPTGTYNFSGLVDDVRIYNYARTPEQILQDYNAGKSIHFR